MRVPSWAMQASLYTASKRQIRLSRSTSRLRIRRPSTLPTSVAHSPELEQQKTFGKRRSTSVIRTSFWSIQTALMITFTRTINANVLSLI